MPQYLRDIYPRPFKNLAERLSGRIRESRKEDESPLLASIKGFFEGATEGLGDLLTDDIDIIPVAGLPFDKYPIKRIYHGTQRLFDKFDPSKYDKNDVLGWMTHGAEDPEYAGIHYAMGRSKGLKTFNINDDYPDVETEGKFWDNLSQDFKSTKVIPHMLPLKPEAKNVLDLVDPNSDDISQALAALPPLDRAVAIREFKDSRRYVRDMRTRYGEDYTSSQALANDLGIARNHLPDKMDFAEIPIRVTADKLRLTPEQFKRSPFDAIRYRDNEHKSWAIPEDTAIRSAISPEITLQDVPQPLRIIRNDTPSRGSLMYHPENSFRDFAVDKQTSSWELPQDVIQDLETANKAKKTWEQYYQEHNTVYDLVNEVSKKYPKKADFLYSDWLNGKISDEEIIKQFKMILGK